MQKSSSSLFILLTIMSTFVLTAQISFKVNFDSEVFGDFSQHPEYTLIDLDKLPLKFPGVGSSWYHPTISVRKIATSSSNFSVAGSADNWLITPKVFVPPNNPYLKWTSGTADNTIPENYEIWISTSSKDVKDFQLAFTQIETSHQLISHNIEINSYGGDSVYIAFRHVSRNKRELFIQDIEVGGRSPLSIEVTKTDLYKYVLLEAKNNLSIKLKNTGSVDIHNFRLNYQIDEGPIAQQWISHVNIAWDKEITILLNKPTIFNEMGIIPLKIWCDSINNSPMRSIDESDKFTQQIYPVNKNIKKHVYVEEMTAAWCQACPNGSLFFEELLSKYDRVIGGSFHSRDIMAIDEMQPIINDYASFFPGGLVDRVGVEGKLKPYRNAGQWEPGIIEQLKKVSPVEVKVKTTIDLESREIRITLMADYHVNSDVEYRLNIIIVEDSVTGGEQYNQANAGNDNPSSPFYNRGNPMEGYYHRHVIRKVLGGAWGMKYSSSGNTESGDIVIQEYAYIVPAAYNIHKITVIGLVQEYNNELYDRQILNCVKSQLTLKTKNIEKPDNAFLIYPNPAHDYLYLKTNQLDDHAQVKIISLEGKILSSLDLTSIEQHVLDPVIKIDIKELTLGTYFIQIIGKDRTITQKWVKI